MSTVIRSCPGCKSLILSDTDQCPECGHVLHERKNSANSKTVEGSSLRSATLLDPCPHCGEMVRTGLVRCWSCNGFMREDIAARYRKMTSNPQQIIYSTIPADQRTDYLPARDADNKNAVLKAYDSEGFVLSGSSGSSNPQPVPEDGFELGSSTTKSLPVPQPAAQINQPGPSAPEANATKAVVPVDGPDKPKETTPGGAATAREAGISAQPEVTSAPTTEAPSKTSRGAKGGEDDLLSIAMQDEREVRKRRSDKLAERKQKQMLVPCACGAWIRVHESQAGKSVRCRKCKQPVVVPQIRRKTEKKTAEKSIAASIDVTWIEGVRFVRLAPTSIVLKPGSVADKFIEADLAVTDSQIVVVAFSGGDKKKRGLLSKAPKVDRAEQRRQLREQISKTGNFSGLADVEVHTIPSEQVPEIRLVQPILKASESMFAGVPVFGDGRIAVFLPISLDNNEQAYCSQTLTAFRTLCDLLKKMFNVELPAAENGVPAAEKVDNLSCFINQSRVESLRDVIYYEQDAAFELELSGFRCKACTAVISEEGRLKNKLGGSNGKAIAKAKCPKCSGKMGEERLYRIKKAGSADAAAK